MSKKDNKHVCRFCNKKFVRETAFFSHACEKRKRWNAQDTRPAKIGFMAWLDFMKSISAVNRNAEHTYEDFIHSRLYTAFVKFGDHMTQLNAVEPQGFINFLIKNNIKVKDWVKDYPYETYIRNKIAKETPNEAIERSLFLAEEWALDNDSSMEKFFEEIDTARALYWITTGKISPWFIMASSKASRLLSRFTPEQAQMMNKYIDTALWKIKVSKYRKDFDNIKSVLRENNL